MQIRRGFEEFAAYYYLKDSSIDPIKRRFIPNFLNVWGLERTLVPDTKDKLQELLMEDMENTLNHDAVKKFLNKGWEMA